MRLRRQDWTSTLIATPVVAVGFLLLPWTGSAMGSLQGDAEQAIRSAGFDIQDVSITVIEPGTGRRIVDVNGDISRIPASNMKLLTSGSAAHLLGTDYTFKTKLVRDGDRLIVIGDGDPAFGDPELLELMTDADGRPMDIERFLAIWADAVAGSGMTRVEELVIDDRIFDREYVHPSWPREQLVKRYCAGVSGLVFHLNTIHFYPRPGSQRADLSRTKPRVDFLDIRNLVTSTPKKRQADLVDVQRAHGTNTLTFRGNVTVPMNASIEVTMHDMPTIYGRILADRIEARGIEVERVRLATASDPVFDGTIIGPVIATPLQQVLRRCNVDSSNIYAEALLKKLGSTYSRSSGPWENGATVIRHVVQERLSRPDQKLNVADGSGMSRQNRVTTRTLATWLSSFDVDDAEDAMFIDSLPVPGKGTLKKRFPRWNVDGTSIHAKSGYLRGACSLSGFVMTSDGRQLAFSIIVNDDANRVRNAKAMQEKIVTGLARSLASQQLSEAGR